MRRILLMVLHNLLFVPFGLLSYVYMEEKATGTQSRSVLPF